MGAHKLDIEFEDEDDLKAKEIAAKKEAAAKKAAESVDLVFGNDDSSVGHSSAPAGQRQQQQQRRPSQSGGSQVQTSPYMHASPGAANYNLGDELRSITQGNRILEIELQAKVEIAVTHRLTTIIAENAQDNKVLENKVNKIVSQIAAKVPALKRELLMIKKLLADHSTVDKSKIESEPAQRPKASVAPKKKTS